MSFKHSPHPIPTPPESVSDDEELSSYDVHQDLEQGHLHEQHGHDEHHPQTYPLPRSLPPSPRSASQTSPWLTYNSSAQEFPSLHSPHNPSDPPLHSPSSLHPSNPRSFSPSGLLSPSSPRTHAHLLNPNPYPSSTRLRSTSARPRPRRYLRLLNSEPFWLFLYFLFNLSLTLFNKLVLVRFPFPYTLTALHALAGTLGTALLAELGVFTPSRPSRSDTLLLAAFSILYTINIAVSNLSLQLVTVPFHQVVRAATPLFVLAMSWGNRGARPTRRKIIALIPVVIGVAFATYGDYYFTTTGLLLTLLGTFLAALKTIVTHRLQTGTATSLSSKDSSLSPKNSSLSKKIAPGGLNFKRFLPSHPIKLHPLDLLLRMSPLAFIQCVFYAWLSGELERVRTYSAVGGSWGVGYNAHGKPVTGLPPHRIAALVVNATMAFGLNVVSFTANSRVGPLSITVAANIKQVLTILLSVSLFSLTITPMNGLGIGLTLLGGAWYAGVEVGEKERKSRK